MYPTQELADLERKKEILRGCIARTREQAAAAAAELARPISWAERAVARWRRMSPFVRVGLVPVVLLLRRRFARKQPRPSRLVRFLRWTPVVLRVVRAFADQRG